MRAMDPSAFMISQMTRCGSKPRELGEGSQPASGMARADQDAARLRQSPGRCGRAARCPRAWRGARSRRATRARAIGRGDSGAHAARGLDGDRERGSHGRAVVVHHQREVQLAAALLGERKANEGRAQWVARKLIASGVTKIRGEDEVAFVLAILGVGKHDHAGRGARSSISSWVGMDGHD